MAVRAVAIATGAIIFNRKDSLHDSFLAQHFLLSAPAHGMGPGMVPDQFLANRERCLPLEEELPGRAVEVALYWHHWEREPLVAQRLTGTVRGAAGGVGSGS